MAIFAITLSLAMLFSRDTSAHVTLQKPQPGDLYQTYTFFASSTSQTNYATSTNATSTNIAAWTDSNGRVDNGYAIIAGAKRVTFELIRGDVFGGGNTGTSTFQIQVSPNGSDWYYWGKWVENASSTIGFTTRSYTTPGISLMGTSTLLVSMDTTVDTFFAARCIVVELVDGSHACKVHTSF